MEFRILGPLEVRAEGQELHVRQGLPRALLIGLLLRRGQTVVADVLIDWLWPERPPANAANALQIQVSYLRKTLALPTAAGAVPALVTRAGGYALLAAAETVDAEVFTSLAAEAESSAVRDPAAALDAAERALALWRGHPLTDVAYASFAQGDVARLEAVRLSVMEARNEALLGLGRHQELLAVLEPLIGEHPVHEPFHAQRVLALYRAGRQADALQAYEAAREVLVEGLGLDPGARLRELEQAVLRQDPSLDWAPPAGGATAGTAQTAKVAPRLPAPLTALIGREHEVAHLTELLGTTRCLTLTGPGGAGKTTLALELARAEKTRRPVWLAELDGASDANEVELAIAAATGAATPPDRRPLESVIEHVDTQAGLLVLDNCEHVVAAAADAAAALLRRCPDLAVLSTSRRPLNIQGELAWPVPPLRLPAPDDAPGELADSPAVRLFTERARAARADFTLDPAGAAVVSRLCALLDGLPLAIELAAARVSVLSPREILERLDDRFSLLVGMGRDAPDRQRSLAGAIAWSHDLLEETERTMFARLAVFTGPFAVQGAIDIAGHDLPGALDVLDGLVRQSLVVAEGGGFRMLESIRDYAARRLAEDPAEQEAARRRHARWHADWAASAAVPLRTPEQAGWLEDLRAATPNLRAALSWSFAHEPATGVKLAGALAWFWGMEARFTEARHWLDLAIHVAGAPEQARAEALFGAGLHAASLGELSRARGLCDEAAALFAHAGDDDGLGRALLYRGVAEWGLGELDAAAGTHDQAVAVFTRDGSAWGIATAGFLRARTAMDADEPDVGELLERAEEDARATGDRHLHALVVDLRARHRLDLGEPRQAEALARASVSLHESVGFLEGVAASLHALALALAAQGRQAEAWEAQRRGLHIAVEASHPAGAAEAAEGLAAVLAAVLPEDLAAVPAGTADNGRGHADAAWLLETAARLRQERSLPAPVSHQRRLAPARTALTGVAPVRRPQAPPLAALASWLREHAAGPGRASGVQGP